MQLYRHKNGSLLKLKKQGAKVSTFYKIKEDGSLIQTNAGMAGTGHYYDHVVACNNDNVYGVI